MKPFIVLMLAASLSSWLYANPISLSAPSFEDSNSQTFGAKFDSSLAKVSLASLNQQPERYLNSHFQTQTRIAKVCQKKGCFFVAQQGQYVLRVSFKDYAFFIPTDSNDKVVNLNGVLVKKNRTPEQTAHFNKDLKSETLQLQSGDLFEIVASSIKVPKNN